jgi:hypothetical protein
MPRRTLVFGYGVLFAALVIAVIVTEVWSDERIPRVYGANVVAEIIGIILTVFFVNKVIQWQRERYLAPIRRHALGRTGGAMAHLLMMLTMMFKGASSPAASMRRPSDLHELLAHWPTVVERLDFISEFSNPEAPAGTTVAAVDYYRNQFELMNKAVAEAIDRYSEALGVQLIDLLETLLSDPIFMLIRNMNPSQDDRRRFREHVGPFLALGSRTGFDQRDDFIRKVNALIEEYAKARFPIAEDFPLADAFRNDFYPPWGLNRYDGPLSRNVTETVVFGRPGQRLPRLPDTPRRPVKRRVPNPLLRLRDLRARKGQE